MTAYIPKQTECIEALPPVPGVYAVYHPSNDDCYPVMGIGKSFVDAYNAMLDDLYDNHVDDFATDAEAADFWNELQAARL